MMKNLFFYPRSRMRDSRAFKVVWIMLAVFLLVSTDVLADGIKITGVVRDANGEGLPGVNVIEEGVKSGNGTITDMNGRFTLSVNSNRSQLRFSFIGYETQVVAVGKRTIINVELKEQTTLMDEVVVVGYGSMRRKDLSGAISSVRSSDLMQGAPTSLTQGLQGRLAGVLVNQSDGAPGSGVSITVRGTNSFSTNSQPLYIVDGIPFETGGTPTSGANEGNNTTAVGLL